MFLSTKEILLGATMRREVANVEEAVELAHQLKKEGRFDWFRGQVSDRRPHSSLVRVYVDGDKDKIAKAEARQGRFRKWVRREADLRYLLESEHVHDFWAIAQHYGIPTSYIDFTTNPAVAGFFAADTNNPPSEGLSCIYCLKSQDLKYVWGEIKETGERLGAALEAIMIDVRNLWRLQAQSGTFVAANYNWEIDYPLDRILFPYSGYPAYPTRERVYPRDKSPLEQALDRYFALEKAESWYVETVKQVRARGWSASILHFETWASGYSPQAFVDNARMVPLESWRPEALEDWEIDPVEDFFETIGPPRRLKLKPTTDPVELRRIVSFGVKQILRSEPGVRTQAFNWEFTDLADQISSDQLNDFFRPAWNGMRRLPYADAEIADALGSIVALLIASCDEGALEPGSYEQRFSHCFGPSIKVGFDYYDGSASNAYVSRQSLVDALRPDMADLLSRDHQGRVGDIVKLFQVIYNPSLMFEFEPFKTAFASQIIPAQVVQGRGQTAAPGPTSPILFNPARLITFGNA